jgi:hypothetical protein
MAKAIGRLKEPAHNGDFQFVRDAAGGAFWQGRDGMIVRVAAPEPDRLVKQETIDAHRELLALACREALDQ